MTLGRKKFPVDARAQVPRVDVQHQDKREADYHTDKVLDAYLLYDDNILLRAQFRPQNLQILGPRSSSSRRTRVTQRLHLEALID